MYDRKRLVARADALAKGWRWRRALVLYRQVLAAEPHDAELHARVAPLLARSGRGYEARESFRIAESGFRRGQEEARAVDMVVAASEALPDDPDVARRRAKLERSRGEPKSAAKGLVRTADRIARRRRGEAIVLLRVASQIHPRDPEIILRLARLLHRDGQAGEALFVLAQIEDRTTGDDTRTLLRLRARIDPTVGNLWAWLAGSRSRAPRRRRARSRATG